MNMPDKAAADLPGSSIGERPVGADTFETEGDGGAHQHLSEAWNHLALFIGSADNETEIGQAMMLLAQLKSLMSNMTIEPPDLEEEDPEADPNADPNATPPAKQTLATAKPAQTVVKKKKRSMVSRASLDAEHACLLDDRVFGTLGALQSHLKTVHGK